MYMSNQKATARSKKATEIKEILSQASYMKDLFRESVSGHGQQGQIKLNLDYLNNEGIQILNEITELHMVRVDVKRSGTGLVIIITY